MRKLLILIVVAILVWVGARFLVHRGEVKATVVFHDARGLRKGDQVMEGTDRIGRITSVSRLDGDAAVSFRIDRAHARSVVTDSFFTINEHALVVSNTFAIGKPIADGAILRAREDRVGQWLVKHGQSLQPILAKAKRAIDGGFDDLDRELDAAKAHAPQWKREGGDAIDRHVAPIRARVLQIEGDLRKSNRIAEAKAIRQKFEHWIEEMKH
jgi:hypothetical protein